MRCEECGLPATAGVCLGPHAGVDARRYVTGRHLVFESWPPPDKGIVEQVDGDGGVMTVVRGERVWRIRGDLEWLRRRVAEGDQATPAHHEAELRKAIDRIVEMAGRFGLEVEITAPEYDSSAGVVVTEAGRRLGL